MALPAQISVSFDFSSGATFGYPFTIGDDKYGLLGTGTLGSSAVPEPTIDLTPNVRNITIERGRNLQSDQYVAGTAIVRVLDPDSYFNPQNTSSPYYGYLVPLRKLRVAATTATTQHFLFSGYTTEYRYTYPQGQETGYVDIYVADAFRLFNLAQVDTVASAGAGQSTGTRIGKILDQINFPANMRTLATGQSSCIADPGSLRTSLAAILNTAFCEQGAFYIDPSGTAVFKDRNTVVSSIAATPIEFNQTTGIPYKNLVFAFDDKLIINQASMQRYGGTAQFAQNAASVEKYFPHQYSAQDLVIDTDANALNIAATYVATRAETTIRIDAMTVDLLDAAVPTDTMIALDYFDVVKITNEQPDGSTIVKTLQVQGLAWEISPNAMTVKVTTLEPITDGFVIGSTERGIIGVSAMTY
ncbi:hypothetical protein UFOVP550_9 [uncultured Caudovirales phage]|uniref:Uncharacterized protein n=1 Tax=uncultured Caudovirales phage TaxID=2100421 RepID=A0A6J5MQY5_9CAUD|nr:hypothetical protein UFOVP550_9 [uncultured Caudovirales phage]